VYANNQIKTEAYIKGKKLGHISEKTALNYKNTLKTLR